MTLSDCYPQTWDLFSHHQRSFILHQMETNTENRIQTMCGEQETLERWTLKGIAPSNPSPQRSGSHTWLMMLRKQGPLNKHDWGSYELAETEIATQGLHGSEPDESQIERSEHMSPPLTLKHSTINNQLQTKNYLSLRESFWGKKPFLRTALMFNHTWPLKNKFNGILCLIICAMSFFKTLSVLCRYIIVSGLMFYGISRCLNVCLCIFMCFLFFCFVLFWYHFILLYFITIP